MTKSNRNPSELYWIGSSKKDLLALPPEVRRSFGYALRFAQDGDKHDNAKVMRGFSGAGVLEVVEDFDKGTYRAAYTVKFAGVVYVLHVFQKKSKSGIETPKADMDLIRQRLKEAESRYAEYLAKEKGKKHERD